jgi:hypothetical protein
MRNYSYETLGLTVEALKSRLQNQQNVLIKAVQEGSLEKMQEEVDEVNTIAKAINSQFLDLKKDFESGAINMVRYKDNLSKLNDLLPALNEKVAKTEIKAEEIAREIKRFF